MLDTEMSVLTCRTDLRPSGFKSCGQRIVGLALQSTHAATAATKRARQARSEKSLIASPLN